jgi:HD domain
MLVATKPKLPTEVSEVRVPDSPLAIETTRFVSRITPLWLMNHVMRTYIFAELLGRKDKMKYDHEILYLGAIMHDLGLTDEFAGTQRFELDGADAARRFLLRQGVPKARVDLVWDAISFHTSSDDDARCSLGCKQQLLKEAQSCPTVSSWLYQDVNDRSVLIHRSP